MKKIVFTLNLIFVCAFSAFSQKSDIKLKKQDFIFSDTTNNGFINNYYRGGYVEMIYIAPKDMDECEIEVFFGKTKVNVYLVKGLKKGQRNITIVKVIE